MSQVHWGTSRSRAALFLFARRQRRLLRRGFVTAPTLVASVETGQLITPFEVRTRDSRIRSERGARRCVARNVTKLHSAK
jgi:hypothetical protein